MIGQGVSGGEAEDERAEADALDLAGYQAAEAGEREKGSMGQDFAVADDHCSAAGTGRGERATGAMGRRMDGWRMESCIPV